MAATGHRMEGEEQEVALFSSSSSYHPCSTALYYVQSPSTASHANSNSNLSLHPPSPDSSALVLSPGQPIFPADDTSHRIINCNTANSQQEDQASSRRLALALSLSLSLSRYSSSSRGSITYDLQSRDSCLLKSGGRLCIVDELQPPRKSRPRGISRFVAVDLSSPCVCVLFQIAWRLLVSFGAALLVFFLVTKPPVPKVSFKVVGFKQFSLREGLDNTGVATKILSSNCSVGMEIDNNSKAFGLHVHSPTLDMDFGILKLASSLGPDESYVESGSYSILGLYVAVKDRPVYGAGRSMQDMLESGQGLPLTIRMGSRSSYRVVGDLIRLRYRHQEECLLILDHGGRDDVKHGSIHIRNVTCATKTRRA